VRATLDHFEIPVADSRLLATFLKIVFGWIVIDAGANACADVCDNSGEESAEASEGERYCRLGPASLGPDSERSAVRVGLFEGPAEVLDRAVPVVRLTGETLELCLERVASAGGRVTLQPKWVGHSGRFARFEDPEGNHWGLWEPSPIS